MTSQSRGAIKLVACFGALVLLVAGIAQQTTDPFPTWTALVMWLGTIGLCRRSPLSGETILLGGAAVGLGLLAELRIGWEIGCVVVLTAAVCRTAGSLLTVASLGFLPAVEYVAGDWETITRVAAISLLPVAWYFRSSSFRLPARGSLGPILTAVGIAGAAMLLTHSPAPSRTLANLPKNGLLFRSEPISLPPGANRHLANVESVRRRYRVPIGQFDLLAIDGRHDRHAVHDPTFCHLGDGWTVRNRRTLPLPGGEAAIIDYSRGSESTQCVFWFTNGRARSKSAWWYWSQTTLRRLSLGQSGSEPVLVVLQPVGRDRLDWQRVMNEFPALASF